VESSTPLFDDIYVYEDDTSESDALHLHLFVAHDEIPRQIATNDDYKFAAYPHSILQLMMR